MRWNKLIQVAGYGWYPYFGPYRQALEVDSSSAVTATTASRAA